MAKFNTVPLGADGQPLTDEALASFLDEAEPLAVPYTKRNGETATFHVLADHMRVKAPHLKKYQREVAAIAERAERGALEEQEREEARAQAVEAAEAVGEDVPDEMTAEDMASQLDALDVLQEYAEAEAQLLGRLVTESNIPGLVIDPEKGVAPSFLAERAGIGPALRVVLRGYFFPSSKQSEEGTGSEEVNTEITSSTSEATDDEATTPSTS